MNCPYRPAITVRHHEEFCVKKRLRKEVHVIAYPVLAKLVSKSGKSVWKKAERREPGGGDFDVVEQQFQ
jgi:hypothetical protein